MVTYVGHRCLCVQQIIPINILYDIYLSSSIGTWLFNFGKYFHGNVYKWYHVWDVAVSMAGIIFSRNLHWKSNDIAYSNHTEHYFLTQLNVVTWKWYIIFWENTYNHVNVVLVVCLTFLEQPNRKKFEDRD